jgi:hypothetical protein
LTWPAYEIANVAMLVAAMYYLAILEAGMRVLYRILVEVTLPIVDK